MTETQTTKIDRATTERHATDLKRQAQHENAGSLPQTTKTKIYVVSKHYAYEGNSAPIAIFDNIEYARMFFCRVQSEL